MATSNEPIHEFLAMQARGVLSLPAGLRKKYGLDKPGAQVEITEREDGVIELRPQMSVPASQAWFWDAQWQVREREVDVQVDSGAVTVHDDAAAFVAHLDALAIDEQTPTG